MADVTGMAFTVVFIAVLLTVGVFVFAFSADIAADEWHYREEIIAAGDCANGTSPSITLNVSGCEATVANPPIEATTRVTAVVENCSTASGGTCNAMTDGTHYNISTSTGTIHVQDDIYGGSIQVSYWADEVRDTVDNAQKSITSTVYGGFELATVLTIILAAVGIMGGIMLIGKR